MLIFLFVFCRQTLYEAQVVPNVLPSVALKYLLAADSNQFGLADLAEVCCACMVCWCFFSMYMRSVIVILICACLSEIAIFLGPSKRAALATHACFNW